MDRSKQNLLYKCNAHETTTNLWTLMQANYEYLTAFRNSDNLHGHLSQKNQKNRINFCFAFVQF